MLVGLISLWTRPRWCSRPSAPERATARRRNLPTLDRKSTRLNSSHLGISYAVFCLKKKKQLLLSVTGHSDTIEYEQCAHPLTPRLAGINVRHIHSKRALSRASLSTIIYALARYKW